MKLKSKPVALSLYFGIPGAGKSTYAAYLAKQDMKKGRKVWSNFGITGAMKCDKSDFGKYMMTDGRLIIDEAGLEYDNRKMSMTNDEIYKARHKPRLREGDSTKGQAGYFHRYHRERQKEKRSVDCQHHHSVPLHRPWLYPRRIK